MQQKHIDMIRKFRIMMGLPYNDSPIEVPITWQHTHYDLIAEEIEEYFKANNEVDKIDALIDAFIFCLGALDHCGNLKLNPELSNNKFNTFIHWIAWQIIYSDFEFHFEFLDFWPFFEIVMESNFSKACSSMEAAKAKQDEYHELWKSLGDYESQCFIEVVKTGGEEFIILKRRFDEDTFKILKGDQYWKPEPKLEEELKRQIS